MDLLTGLMVIGVATITPIGMGVFFLGMLISIVVCLTLYRERKPGVVYWLLAVAFNVPSLILIARFAFDDGGAEAANSNLGLTLLVFFLSGPLGAGWLAGSGFGLLAKLGLRTTKAMLA